MKENEKGFTLIELLVVVIIIGVLSAIAIPGYLRSMEKTKAASAMQALADIAKAEHDYFAVQSRYTDDFGDLTITMKDESAQQDADGESYTTKHFTIELDGDLEAAKATRSGGDAPYTLYRLFDDPRIYCQPEDNKYCQMLGLPAGSFGASACPEGYTCNDSGATNGCDSGYYFDFNSGTCGTSCPSGFTCNGDTMTGPGNCANTTEYICNMSETYNASGRKISQVECGYYSGGQCDSDMLYSSNFNEHGDKTSFCRVQNPSSCTNFSYTYDEYGNKLTKLQTSDGYAQLLTTYDYSGGQLVSSTENQRICATSNSDGSCATFKYNQYSTYNEIFSYDANGNATTKVRKKCASVDTQTGECTSYREKWNCSYQGYWNCNYACTQYTINPITGDC